MSKTVEENVDYSKFEKEFIDTLNKHAPKEISSFAVIKNLMLNQWVGKPVNSNDKIEQITAKFYKHPSILKIKQKVEINKKFSLQSVSEDTVRNVVKNLPDIVPVFKKLDPTDETNFRPVTLLPLLSKVFEKIKYDQLYEYAETFLNKFLCAFSKAHSTQHALFRLLQKWQKELDSSGIVGTILMNLSKAYDCLPHDLVIAKLEAYGLDTNSLRFFLDYLSCRKQITKI